MYETYNFFVNYLKKNNHLKNLEESYIKILTCFSPIIPHFSSECLEDLKYNDNLSWPKYDNALLDKEKNKCRYSNKWKKKVINKY